MSIWHSNPPALCILHSPWETEIALPPELCVMRIVLKAAGRTTYPPSVEVEMGPRQGIGAGVFLPNRDYYKHDLFSRGILIYHYIPCKTLLIDNTGVI